MLLEHCFLLLKLNWLVSNRVKYSFVCINQKLMRWQIKSILNLNLLNFQFFIFSMLYNTFFSWTNKLFETKEAGCVVFALCVIRFFHQSHNTVHFGGLFTLKQWIISSLKHDTVPRVNKLDCFYVKNPPKRIALWDRENSQYERNCVGV